MANHFPFIGDKLVICKKGKKLCQMLPEENFSVRRLEEQPWLY
jgi:hypothetical protein